MTSNRRDYLIVVSIVVGLLVAPYGPPAAMAANDCAQTLAPSPASVREQYPALDTHIKSTVQALKTGPISIDKPVTEAKEIKDRTSLRIYDGATVDLPALDPVLQSALVAVFNKMIDRAAFAAYVEKLMEDAAVEMTKTPDARVRVIERSEGEGSTSYRYGKVSRTEWITRRELLVRGELDNSALMKVLVHRARARSAAIAVIPKQGNYNGNKSKHQKYERFYDVPARGPFFDKAFGTMTSHGRDVHMVQMDYVAPAIDEATGGKPELFWQYATKYKTGTWVWDTMFDGNGSTWMCPEHTGDVLRKHIPIF